MLTLKNITKTLPNGKLLFEDVNITFAAQRYGLTGPNGSGKSTLMRIMMGLEEPTSGELMRPKRVGFLKQNIADFHKMKLLDVVVMGNQRLWAALQKREALYEQEMSESVGIALGNLEEIIAEEEGYTAESEAATLLEGIGIQEALHERRMETLPQDKQFRALLCQALFGKPELLLLDEPTNHLDLESISWFEQLLLNFKGTLIVTSHDRHFLNTVTQFSADIDYETVIVYPGGYDEMIITKSQLRARIERENRAKEKKVAQLKEFIAKFQAGTRASQVKSRLKEVDKLQPSELKKSNIVRPYIFFPPIEKPSGKRVLQASQLTKAYDGLPVIQNLNLDIDQGDKIGVIGNNGLGKTTLLKMLSQRLAPTAGEVNWGFRVEAAYFPQNHDELLPNSEERLFDYLKRQKPRSYDQEIRDVLGRMLFQKEEVFKPLNALSGGERARLILASHLLIAPNTLFYDEPNNHLDLEAVSALCTGLSRFQGTVVLVAHDRNLINEVATKLLVFDESGIQLFLGTLDDYLAKNA